jgi:transcriptional regulator with XRE-family HTH domain
MPRDRNRVDWFGPRLRELREAAGLTQTQLGERAGVVGSQVNKLEVGVNQPTFATALALAQALGVEIGAFVPAGQAPPRPDRTSSPQRGRGRPRKQPQAGQTPCMPGETAGTAREDTGDRQRAQPSRKKARRKKGG